MTSHVGYTRSYIWIEYDTEEWAKLNRHKQLQYWLAGPCLSGSDHFHSDNMHKRKHSPHS